MAENSLTGALSIGKQTDRTTQATAFITTLATVSNLAVAFDTRQPLLEHPSSVAGVSFDIASPLTRTGYLVPWGGTFLLRPKFFPRVLQALGFSVATTANTPETGTHTHVCTIAADSSMLWMSVIHNVGTGGGEFNRLALGARASRLSMTATNETITCDVTGTALVEGNVSGSPTYTSEVSDEISPAIGSVTCNFDAATLVSSLRGITWELANTLKEGTEERPLFQSTRDDLARDTIGYTGTLQGVDVDFNLWKKIIRGGTSGTAPSLVVVTGDLAYQFESASNIGATATPYSVNFEFSEVQYDFPTEGIRNQNSDLVRVDLSYTGIGTGTPVTITVINDVASY